VFRQQRSQITVSDGCLPTRKGSRTIRPIHIKLGKVNILLREFYSDLAPFVWTYIVLRRTDKDLRFLIHWQILMKHHRDVWLFYYRPTSNANLFALICSSATLIHGPTEPHNGLHMRIVWRILIRLYMLAQNFCCAGNNARSLSSSSSSSPPPSVALQPL
jgi:hypothetical protein